MLHFLKYLIYFCIFISLLLFYFLFTPLGTSDVYSFVGKKLSKKTGLHIKIKSIDITTYPHVQLVMYINKKAKLTLWGYLDDSLMDMDYTLTSDCIATNLCKIDDDINIKGHIKGPFSRLKITGKGKALDGNVTYSATKYTDKVENIHLDMQDLNSSKLLHLLGQTALIKGKSNASFVFSHMDNLHKKGYFTYEVSDKNFQGIPIHLRMKVDVNDDIHTFKTNITSPYLKLDILKGRYSEKTKNIHAFYILDIQELNKLETLLGYKYQGAFNAQGEMSYDTFIKVTGVSKSFGGITNFTFEKDMLKIKINHILLEKMMHLFPFPAMLTANATGDIDYSFIDKKLIAKTTLKNAKFVHTKLVDIIRKKSHVNLLKETFDNSTLDLNYQNKTILGNIKLKNKHSHVYLTSTEINTDKSTINAYFDFKMQHQEFSGKVFGPLESPKVNLNMQKLVRYQMDKQVDKMIGKDGRKIMEHMPMGGVAKDMATGMGASFIKVFF